MVCLSSPQDDRVPCSAAQKEIQLEAGLGSKTVHVTDISCSKDEFQTGTFAQQSCGSKPTAQEDTMVMMTRIQKIRHDQEVIALVRQDRESEATSTPVVQTLEPEEVEEILRSNHCMK